MTLLILAVVSMLVQQAFAYMSGLVMPVAAPAAAKALDVDPALIGVFTGLVFFASMFSHVSCGAFIQRHGPLRISQISLCAMATGLLIVSTGSLPLIALGALIIGMGTAPSTPASSQILARLSPPHLAPLLFSIKQTGVPVGAMLAGAIVPLSVAAFGWRGAFFVAAAMCLTLAVILQPLRAPFDRERNPNARFSAMAVLGTIRDVLRAPELRVMAIAAFAFVGLQSVFASFFVIYLTQALSHDLQTAGFAFSIAQGAAIPARIFWGWIAGRLSAARMVLAGLGIGMAAASVLLGLTGATWSLPAIIAAGCAYTCTAVSWHGVLLAEVARVAPREQISGMTGGVLAFGSAGMMSFPLVFSAILATTGSFTIGFLFAAVPALIAALMLFRR